MTEVFHDSRRDAGYCPKCQKGYSIGPHVCPVDAEQPPSKERDICERLRLRCGHDSRTVVGCLDCEAADEIETAIRLRPTHEPCPEPAGYRVDYSAGGVEAFFFTSPGMLPLDLKGLEEDGRTNVRATPLYRASQPPDPECEWSEIEEGSGIYNTCKAGEEFHLTDGMELWPHCHWCGGMIVVADPTKESAP